MENKPLPAPLDRDELMARARAARHFVNTAAAEPEAAELSAFLALFHPEIDGDRARALVNSKRRT